MEISMVDEQHEELGSPSSCSESSSVDFLDGEEVTSSNEPLDNMSDLMGELPIKRGLSKHFDGKSQSFKSLLDVRSLDDLVKSRGRPYGKRMTTFKSFSDSKLCLVRGSSSRIISKDKMFSGKKHYSPPHHRNHNHHGFVGIKPPIDPQGADHLSGRALLFA